VAPRVDGTVRGGRFESGIGLDQIAQAPVRHFVQADALVGLVDD
jgi:hypothetical protein